MFYNYYITTSKIYRKKKEWNPPSKVASILVLTTMIIIHDNSSNINIDSIKKIIKNDNIGKAFQDIYDSIFNSIDFNSITCDRCSSNQWHIHAYYQRRVFLFGQIYKIRITRIKCKECGKTHAIIIGELIPYSMFLYTHIIELIKKQAHSFENNIAYYFRHKFTNHDIDYNPLCLLQSRNHSCIILPT